MAETEKRTTIAIPVSANEKLKEIKSLYGGQLSMPEFFSVLITKVYQDHRSIFESEHTLTEAAKEGRHEDTHKPAWVHGLMIEDIQKYCYEHPGAMDEYLRWWAETHTPKEVDSLRLTLMQKWWV